MAIFKGGIFSKRRELESFFVNSYGNDQTRGVFTFTIDIDTGEIFYKNHFKTPTDPIYSFNYGRFVCTTYKNRTGAASDGGVCSYASTAQTLGLVSRLTNNGKTYMHACTNNDTTNADRFLGVDYYNGEVVVASIVKKRLTKVLSTYKLEGKSINRERQSQPHPHHICMTPDFKKVIVTDLGLDKILFFDLNDSDELVIDDTNTVDIKPGSGPRQILFNKEGTFAYVINELSNTIDVFSYNDYKLVKIDTIDTYDKEKYPDEVNLVAQAQLTDDGEFLFVLNRGHDSVSLFSIDKSNGKLSLKDFADTSPNPRTLEIFRDKFIVIGCQKGGIIEVVELSREKDGLLFEKEFSYLINEPVCIRRFIDITEKKA